MRAINKITILGDGGWGTTLAILLARKGYKITLWGAFKDNIAEVNKTRINQKFLPGIRLPSSIVLTSDLVLALKAADLIVLAIPSQFIRQVLKRVKELDVSFIPFLSVVKGIETETQMRVSEIIYQELGKNLRLAVLSGPTIALEVAKEVPTTAVVSSSDEKLAKSLQRVFMTRRFRVYTNPDVVGVELGGSLKNVIAIACGISDGLGFGANTKAALLARGLAEISRMGIAAGAKKETFSGITGLGDLVTTCISRHSRNRSVGEQIGKGGKLKNILSRMNMVAEGVATAKAAYLLGKKYRVSMPITNEVYSVLYKNKDPFRAVNDLMTRQRKEE
ncbi:MAG: glycerol-3-phosphate dehydrogenase [Omnitrophica WOR_2 bacterium GWB2_45_9]|nr:MAG: glycerol-3-phosphate dehydrogenase [Omnitrophica WOR_2 bacterium GWB2_45_9]OGX48526.1 MAG: glycerol-3-phosphate dehydrogenase [Omnitrophica WOR_2 bacterium RIFOXYA2_FULL_45_12]OGX51875.1 MAG: glycerol-3-phosphate dehydrogenase [Omnitrophica WOR_2 bacterium RIFOXYB2_FULL_45_11]